MAALINIGAAKRSGRMHSPRRRRGLLAVLLGGLLAVAPLYPSSAAAADALPEAVLFPLLSGEFALQEGRHGEAAGHYLQAARASADPRLAERAARVALAADADALAAAAIERWHALEPDAAGLAPTRATLALRAGDTVQAAQALERLLVEPGGWEQVVRVLAAEHRALAAAAITSSLVDSAGFPAELEPTLAFGSLSVRLGQSGLARRLAQRATDLHPESARAWLWRAEVERRHGDADAARVALDRVRTLPTLEPAMRLALAAQLDALGAPEAAADALASAGADGQLLAARVAYLARAEAHDKLEALYVELDGDGADTAERRYLLGQVAEVLQRDEAALGWYRSIDDGVDRDRAQLRIAVLHDRADQFEAALATLHALQHSDSENGEVLVDAYLLESELLRRRDRIEQSAAALDRGLGVFEDEPQLLYARALAHERHGRIDAAIDDLQRLVALDPDNPNALNALGYTLADRTDRYNEALPLIERALALDPDNAAILDSLGWVLHKLGRSSEALLHLRRSFELARDAEVAAHLGEVLWLLGQRDEARAVWLVGGEIDQGNRALRAALERYTP